MAYGLDEVPLLSVTLATGDDACAILLTALNVVHDPVILGFGYDRTLVCRGLERVTNDLQLSHKFSP